MLSEELREAERAAHEALLRQFSQTSDRLASAYASGAPPATVQTMGPATVETGMQASPHDLTFVSLIWALLSMNIRLTEAVQEVVKHDSRR